MSRLKKSVVAAGLISVFAIGATLAIDKRPDSPGPGASSKELVEAARRAYELAVAQHRLDATRPLGEPYIWSKRWMTAEWDLSLQAGGGEKGVKAHRDRMIDLENTTIALQQAGAATAADVAAASYYRIEAELMLARTGE
jgi:hypothetical protein